MVGFLDFQGQTLGSGERNGARGTDTLAWMDTRRDMKGHFLDVPGDRSQGVLRGRDKLNHRYSQGLG